MTKDGMTIRSQMKQLNGVPKWFDLSKYDCAHLMGAHGWLTQISIRRELLKAVRGKKRKLERVLIDSIDHLCDVPLTSPSRIPLFGVKGEKYSCPTNLANFDQPSGTCLLTKEKFWLLAAWRERVEGTNIISVVAKSATETIDDLDEDGDRELSVDGNDSLDDIELEDSSPFNVDNLLDNMRFAPHQPSRTAIAINREFHERSREAKHPADGWEDPLPAADVLGRATYLLTVDLTLPDSLLKEQFVKQLVRLRVANPILPEKAKRPAYKNWINAGVLPYLDLQLWSAINSYHISNLEFANAILTGTAQGPDTVRITTRGHVRQLLGTSSRVYRGLVAEARREIICQP